MKNKILIIGGNGFVGSHLIDLLIKLDYPIRVLARSKEKYRLENPKVDYRYGDFQSIEFVEECLEGIDFVFHLISSTVPTNSNKDIAYDINSNLIPGINLLNALVKLKTKKIIYISTGGAIYGDAEIIPTPETCLLNPISSYGIQKMAMEHYIKLFNRLHGIDYLIARVSNLYGERQNKSGVNGFINTILDKTIENKPIEIWGDGSQVRDYLHIKDLMSFMESALKKQASGIYNVGFGEGHSINEIIEIVRSISKNEIELVFKSARAFDVKKIVLDISKAKNDLNWFPEISLENGITKLWDFKRKSI